MLYLIDNIDIKIYTKKKLEYLKTEKTTVYSSIIVDYYIKDIKKLKI